jgi:hypothetical protein
VSEINALKGEVGQFKTWQQQQQQERTRETLSAWTSKPGHEHFETVRMDMGRLWSAGIATDLDTAYAKACAMNGLTPTATAQPTPPPVNPAVRARNVRHAAVSPRPAAPNGADVNGAAKPPGSVRESLQRAIDAHRG